MTTPAKDSPDEDLGAERGSPRYNAPALDKGLDILEVLADSMDGCTLNEIAQKLGRSVSEIFRMAVTLERRGYVMVDSGDRYTLSLKMFELAHRQRPLRSLIAVALPLLRELAHRARQSCHLAMYQGGRVVVIAQVDSPERWSFGLKIGVMMGLTDTSSGHVLLAFRDEVERARMLAAHIKVDGELAMDPGELFEILRQVRERGHAVMDSRQIRGVTNVAYPVMGSAGQVIAALNVPHIERIDGQASPSLEQVKAIVHSITTRISGLMGYSVDNGPYQE
ncbi:IclR family transcriptional regulator [Comamonas sp.]|uniref:IclR family transcriptional regulator n=1 Tax=Comamonas sp. TaxID=34028 RepID=UPI002582F0A1|nr:IclR family transcriptional regulator [Comamonas sp.]